MNKWTGSINRKPEMPGGRTVLCVDPDPSCAAALQDAWAQLHLADDLHIVGSQEGALDFLSSAQSRSEQGSVAAVVLDPDATGEESGLFVYEVRKHCGKEPVPILLWSRDSDKYKELEGRDVEGVIKKPKVLRLIQSLDEACRLRVRHFRPFTGSSSVALPTPRPNRWSENMNVTVNTNLCTGCGICEIICPEIFQIQTGGRKKIAIVHSETISEEVEPFCEDARNYCKTKAIQIVENDRLDPVMAVNRLSEFQDRRVAAAFTNLTEHQSLTAAG